jgi:hypothetical protein
MSDISRSFFSIVLVSGLAAVLACGTRVETNQNVQTPVAAVQSTPVPQPTAMPTPTAPNLQAGLLDDRNKTTESAIGKFDFKNFTYPLPRGWENPDGSDITLVNGRRQPVGIEAKGDLTDEEKVEVKANRRIGLSYVTTKYLDVNNDNEDEALVVLKIETGGAAIPQVVYVYSWKDGKPELFWSFRTGDRADGGLKDMRVENGQLVVELYGQDRFLLGQMETGKITGDYEQLCCPSYFSRTFYKWNGKSFLMQGKRLTYTIADPAAAPVENMGEIVNKPAKSGKK